jgi:hypothetical protein
MTGRKRSVGVGFGDVMVGDVDGDDQREERGVRLTGDD